ncbi:MAG: Ig-like domain-containing protein, partial [Sulfitobacter sp.]
YTLGSNTFDIVANGFNIEGFNTGVNLNFQNFTFGVSGSDVDNVFIDVNTSDVGSAYTGFNGSYHTVMSSSQLVDGRLEFNLTGDTNISEGETLYLNGTKTDSIGSRDRQFSGDEQHLTFYDNIAPLLATEGYYRTPDGRNVMLLEDYVADRATGELIKISHVITLNMSQQQIESNWTINQHGGAVFNGTVTFDGIDPAAQDDFATTGFGQDILINVLSNDIDPTGGLLRVDGSTDAENGEVFVQENGQILYRPNTDFSGRDSFDYWAADDDGDFTRATVTVDVFDI